MNCSFGIVLQASAFGDCSLPSNMNCITPASLSSKSGETRTSFPGKLQRRPWTDGRVCLYLGREIIFKLLFCRHISLKKRSCCCSFGTNSTPLGRGENLKKRQKGERRRRAESLGRKLFPLYGGEFVGFGRWRKGKEEKIERAVGGMRTKENEKKFAFPNWRFSL